MRTVMFATILGALLFAAPLAEASRIIPLDEEGWPQFRGQLRDGVSLETGLLQAWPEGGPEELWRYETLGKGYASPIITEAGIFIAGDIDDAVVIHAFDLDGNLKWKVQNGKAWTESWPGARSSCTYSEGRLYHMNGHGRTVCLDPATGKEIWAVEVLEEFEGNPIKWGLSECLVVDEAHVYVTPGGKKAFMAALDKRTGETVWASPPLIFERTYEFGGKELDSPMTDHDNAGYASPLLLEIDGRRILARTSAQHLVCVDAADGAILWTNHIYARHEVIGAIPVYWNKHLFFAAPDAYGGNMYEVNAGPEGFRMQERWKTEFDNCHSSMVAVNGRIYGAGYRTRRDWVALDAATGKELYSLDDLQEGVSIFADGRLYALGQDGHIALLEPTDTEFKIAGEFRIAEGRRRDVWTHPVLLDGRLYLRDHDTLWCYNIKAR